MNAPYLPYIGDILAQILGHVPAIQKVFREPSLDHTVAGEFCKFTGLTYLLSGAEYYLKS
jgi:hypothetical protein